ncbi:flagellar hook assembly protein FlgD [Propionivibrio limicola]|uniref:flagellar hook assembly protein FlgD n=1 Tax=Propionivibrio limicola TaxID=167645 RepID=UPI0012911FC6|nr:flagellar hook capping FlgD N-terminal domain-containing protein [Propionivibrio limicola]
MSSVTTNNTTSSLFSTINANNAGGSTSSSSTSEIDDTQNRFLTLLVTQLQNQDPLNPLENTELTSQLAQMSTVQGIEELNTTLSSLVDSMAETQSMQAAALIGNSVLVSGNNLTLSDGAAYGGLTLASAADQVTVDILNSSGSVIQTQTLGANDAGTVLFSWDGSTSSGSTASDGAYTFKVTATKNGASVTSEAMQIGTVSALVRSSSGGFQLDLGSLGTYAFDDVQQVF